MRTTTFTDTNSATNQDIQLGFNFTNAGTITNANYILIGTQAQANPAPLLTNNGTFNYTTNLGGNSIDAYMINGFNSPTVTELVNNGNFVIMDAAGANEGPTATTLDTQVAITGVVNQSSTGVFNVSGSAQNTIGVSATAPTDAVLEFEQAVTGTGTFALNDGEVQFDDGSAGTVQFQDGSSIVDLANVSTTPTTLNFLGFRAGDMIGLGTTQITRAAYDTTSGLIDLFNAASAVLGTLAIGNASQSYANATFTVTAYPSGLPADVLLPTFNSTRVQSYLTVNSVVPCYCPGTRILTDQGEVAIEDLAIGDRVITLDGSAEAIRWIGRRSYDGRFIEGRRDILPVCITAGAFAPDQPKRDLWVSPLHALYIAGSLVPAGVLVNGVSIVQAEAAGRVDYIHVELSRHSVMWAEGVAAESFTDDDSRNLFHNAAEYTLLHPDQRSVPAVYCAPRLEDGELLETIRHAIDERAGLRGFTRRLPLRGCLDSFDGLVAQGWAQNPANPEAPVCLELVLDGVVVDRSLATVFRPDLRLAGMGSGYHGFRLTLPAGDYVGEVIVRRTGDHAELVLQKARQAA